jgi:hypothetical protein
MSPVMVAVSSCIENIFQDGGNPRNLKRGTSNQIYDNEGHKCEMCEKEQSQEIVLPFEQCKHSVVTVSQTKMGVCLQFFWHPDTDKSEKYYCSVDLIPSYKIVKKEAL